MLLLYNENKSGSLEARLVEKVPDVTSGLVRLTPSNSGSLQCSCILGYALQEHLKVLISRITKNCPTTAVFRQYTSKEFS
jgi:hypothetical protein